MNPAINFEIIKGALLPSGHNLIIELAIDGVYIIHSDGKINGRRVWSGEVIIGVRKNKCGFYKLKNAKK
jgi:hypothetical protein